MGLSHEKAHPLGLALIELEHGGQWQEHEGGDDRKGSVRPAPRGMSEERLRGNWAGERSADERSAGETKSKGPIAQSGGISHKDIQHQVDGVVSHPVQDIAGCIGVGVIASCEDNQTKHIHPDKHQEALCPTPDVQHPGNGQLDHTTNHAGEDVGRADLGSGLEFGVGSLDDIAANRRLQGENKKANPDSIPSALFMFMDRVGLLTRQTSQKQSSYSKPRPQPRPSAHQCRRPAWSDANCAAGVFQAPSRR